MTKDRMEPVVIRAFDLPDLWFKVIANCLEQGYERPVFRGERVEQRRKELDYAVLICSNPWNKPMIPDTPEGVPPPTSMRYVHQYLGYFMTPDKTPEEHYTYGERIAGHIEVKPHPHMIKIDKIEGQRVNNYEFSQLEQAIKFLKETPETNRAIISIEKPEDMILRHPPCLRNLHFKVRYGKLHVAAYFRSWDAWGGLPNNLAALELLKQHIAKEIGAENGPMYAASMGLHLYSGEWELARMVVNRSAGRRMVNLDKEENNS